MSLGQPGLRHIPKLLGFQREKGDVGCIRCCGGGKSKVYLPAIGKF